MLVLSIPVFLPIALAIKLEDGGPIFYRQERWGRNEEPLQSHINFEPWCPKLTKHSASTGC